MDALVDMPKKEPWEGASNIPPTPPPADFDWGAHPEALKELYERELEIYKERASEDAAEMAEKDAFLAKTASFSLHYPHPTGEQVTVEKDSISVGGKKIKRTQVERFVPDEVEYDWGGDERGGELKIGSALLCCATLRMICCPCGKLYFASPKK